MLLNDGIVVSIGMSVGWGCNGVMGGCAAAGIVISGIGRIISLLLCGYRFCGGILF